MNYRKRIRATQAATIFGETSKTFVDKCRRGEYAIQLIQPKPGTTSPIKVLEAQVVQQAKREGLI